MSHPPPTSIIDDIDLSQLPAPRPKTLLVEDCPDTRALLSKLLEEVGFEVTSVKNASECLRKVSLDPKAENQADVVLLDLSLPDLNGYEVAKILRANGYEKPIIAITASPSLQMRMESIHAGCDEFLAKRTLHETLIDALKIINSLPKRNWKAELGFNRDIKEK